MLIFRPHLLVNFVGVYFSVSRTYLPLQGLHQLIGFLFGHLLPVTLRKQIADSAREDSEIAAKAR